MALTYKALEDLVAQIAQEAPACPPNQITLNLSRSVREFLARTQLWKISTPITIEALSTVYTFPTDEDIYIDTIDNASISGTSWIDEVELEDELQFIVSSEFAQQHDGETMIVKASAVPYSIPCKIPSRLVNRYAEFLKAGALSYIYGSKQKPYSDANKAVEQADKFRKGLRRGSKDEANRNKRTNSNWSC